MARLGNGSITSIDGADTDAVDAFLMYHAGAGTSIKEREISREELAAAMVAEGLVQENEDGEIVGPIVISNYANNAAAGTPALGTLFLVDEELRVGDGTTQGGNITGTVNTPINEDITAGNVSRTLDATKSGLYSFFISTNGRTLTISNANSLPIGYRFYAVVYFDATETFTITGGTLSVVLTGYAAGLYFVTIQKIFNVLDTTDWAYSVAEAASAGF
jgi:hypothetical protein